VSSARLSDTSFVVLGLLNAAGGEATPYDLKRVAQVTVFNFWSIPHTQIYTECERLARAGLLAERREEGGRRRRFYRLTAAGRKRLEQWRDEPTELFYELRDPSILKLFFGGDPAQLASTQVSAHQAKLKELEAAHGTEGMPQGMNLATELGMEAERVTIRFWSRLLKEEQGSD
jgi:DNA-binding PadR family transcriptional regulator